MAVQYRFAAIFFYVPELYKIHMVPKNMLDKLVGPHSSVDKVVSANFSLISGHEFESPKEQEGKKKKKSKIKTARTLKELLKL